MTVGAGYAGCGGLRRRDDLLGYHGLPAVGRARTGAIEG